ncbi:glycoside hydrolase family 99-like domain-containing protein [bacterium]|nr:glycoside hydrolase family 99-like domain-containing protein [bacterium]
MNLKIITLIFIFVLISTSLVFPQLSGYKLDIYFQTTSDWASLEFPDAMIVAVDYTVEIDSSGAADIHVFHITKPDTKMVAVTYHCVMLDIPDSVTMVSTKGDWGNVLVRVTNMNGEMPPYPMLEYCNYGSTPGDPTNRREFYVSQGFLAEGGPISLGTDPWVTPQYFMAFYYPWYGNPTGPHGYWFHWDPFNHYASTHEPLLGYYDSRDTAIIRQHIAWGLDYGIDVFIVSWWGEGSHEDVTLGRILHAAEGTDMLFSVYLESCGIDAVLDTLRPDAFLYQLNYVLVNYSSHPNFLILDGLPVVFVYGYPISLMSPDDWQYVVDNLSVPCILIGDSFSPIYLDIFDGCHTYNPLDTPVDELLFTYTQASLRSSMTHKIFCATMLPGYCDTIIRDPGATVERLDGVFYKTRFDVCVAASPNFILITSWNEWHEGSEIEPSVENGYQYLDSTLAFKARWTGGTGVADEIIIPDKFDILCYPNPFNSVVHIDVIGALNLTPLQIEIFDINGRKVRELEYSSVGAFDRPGSPDTRITGSTFYSWTPDKSAPSGIYFIRVTSNAMQLTRKIIYLR